MLAEARGRVGEFEKICFRSVGRLGKTEKKSETIWEESRIASVVDRCLEKYNKKMTFTDSKLNLIIEKLAIFEDRMDTLEKRISHSSPHSPFSHEGGHTPLLKSLGGGSLYEMPSMRIHNASPTISDPPAILHTSVGGHVFDGKHRSPYPSVPASEMTDDHSNLPSAVPSAAASPLTLSLPLHVLRSFTNQQPAEDSDRTAPVDTLESGNALHSTHRHVSSTVCSVASYGLGGLGNSVQRMPSDEVMSKSSIRKKGAPPNTERRASIDVPQSEPTASLYDSTETDTSDTPSLENRGRIDSHFGALERTRIVRFGSPSEFHLPLNSPSLQNFHLASPAHSSSSERSRDTSVFEDDPTAI